MQAAISLPLPTSRWFWWAKARLCSTDAELPGRKGFGRGENCSRFTSPKGWTGSYKRHPGYVGPSRPSASGSPHTHSLCGRHRRPDFRHPARLLRRVRPSNPPSKAPSRTNPIGEKLEETHPGQRAQQVSRRLWASSGQLFAALHASGPWRSPRRFSSCGAGSSYRDEQRHRQSDDFRRIWRRSLGRKFPRTTGGTNG